MNTEKTATEPGYLALFRSGELARRVDRLEAKLASCDVCPRECGVNRLNDERGFCRSGLLPSVANVCAHHGEEPVLSGNRGSGTVFLGNCNLRCAFCQNFQISQDPARQKGNEISCRELAERLITLQEQGCHNINFVSPSHYIPQIVRAVLEAVPLGLRLPLVYNTNAYDSVETLRLLDGIFDIYLPDMKYSDDGQGEKYSQAPDYVSRSRSAIREMYRQVGNLETDEYGIARRGIIVRHLILPEGIAGSRGSLSWLADTLSPDIAMSLMSQYHPVHRAYEYPEISRGITYEEYREIAELMKRLGMENGWRQEMSAPKNYLPDFEKDGHPFE